MNVMILLAHPNPLSFNAAVAKVAQEEVQKKGGEVRMKDLYAMHFNPVLSTKDFEGFHTGDISADIKKEQGDVTWADAVIVVAPVWWFGFPAILKGYFDRVFSLGFAYEYTATGPRGKLSGKKALIITSSGSDEQTANQTGLVAALKTACVDSIFGFCGFDAFQHKNLFAVPTITDEARKQMLTDVRQLVNGFV